MESPYLQILTPRRRRPYFPEIGRSRSSIWSKIAGVLAAASVITAGLYFIPDRPIGKPRTEKAGITLKDPKANTELSCLREAFHRMAFGLMSDTDWMNENCNMVGIDGLRHSGNPLSAFARARKVLLQINETPQDAETWERHIDPNTEKHEVTMDVKTKTTSGTILTTTFHEDD